MVYTPYSFSQAQGYEEIPGPLKLGELPRDARTRIWNAFLTSIRRHVKRSGSMYRRGPLILVERWYSVLRAMHVQFCNRPLDEWTAEFETNRRMLREYIEEQPFNKVFDLIQFVLRHPRCPPGFILQMQRVFEACRLAYAIDTASPPTILPAVTPEEGRTVVNSLQTLRHAGLASSAAHLRAASERINAGDWAGSVRESIHAVESVARQLDPQAAGTLRKALDSLKKRGTLTLHPALEEALSKLYGYTSDEQGVRHALLDRTDAQVGRDEAVFMLGACAAFASYLWRRHAAGDSG